MFNNPMRLATDKFDNIFVSDSWNRAIRKITPEGVVTTIVGHQEPASKSVNENIRVTTGSFIPAGLAIDSNGNIYVACDDHAIRKITQNGAVTILAGGANGFLDGIGSQARFSNIYDVAIDSFDNLYVTDPANHAVREIAPDGSVTTLVAESTNSFDATISSPFGVAVGKNGVVYLSDPDGIYKMIKGEPLSDFAGGSHGFADGNSNSAEFYNPTSLTVDSLDNLYVLDEGNEAIRKISPEGVVTTIVARRRMPITIDK